MNKLVSRGKVVIPEAPLQERAFSIKSFSQISSIGLANIPTFLLVELNRKVTDEDLGTACIEIRKQLGGYFETLAPPELVYAYTALQATLNSLNDVDEGLKKAITALQKTSKK